MAWTFVLLFLCALLYRAYRNTFHPAVNRVCVPVASAGRERMDRVLPLRILHLSDLHMENISVPAERILDELNEEPLDLIAITGDFLDRVRSIPKALAYIETLGQLRPAYGMFAVFGNHDYVLAPDKLAQFQAGLKRLGCRVLRNETVTLDVDGTRLHVIGVDDYATGRSDLDKAFCGADGGGIRLVLTHDPNVVLEMKAYDYDYLLSGHFHGGQIHWPKPFHLAKMGELPRMNIVKGLHYRDGRPFYISEGLGQTGVNLRLRSRPEITIHTLGDDAVASPAAWEMPKRREAAAALAASSAHFPFINNSVPKHAIPTYKRRE